MSLEGPICPECQVLQQNLEYLGFPPSFLTIHAPKCKRICTSDLLKFSF